MSGTLWKKVSGDLLVNKTRTALVVLSIAVGVFAIGAIAGSHLIFSRAMTDNFMKVSPGNILAFSDPFDAEVVEAIRKIPGVEAADGRRTLTLRVRVGPEEWKQLNLTVIPDYDDIRVNKLKRVSGAWPPPERGVLIERSSLLAAGVKTGDQLLVETPDGKQKTLKMAGIVHDLNQFPSYLTGTINGYITFDTLEALGEEREMDTLHILTAARIVDREELAALGKVVWDKVEKGGRKVYWTNVLPRGQHPMHDGFSAILFLLIVLGALSLLLSGFLLVNTVTAILAQQIRQIGVMKAIGGTTRQIFAVYLATVLSYSLLALLVAVPLGALGAMGLTFFQAELANIEVPGFQIAPEVVLLQAAVALIVPVLASLFPLLRGVGVPVREAIGSYGIGSAGGGKLGQAFDRKLDELAEKLQSVSRPLLLSLRNTFRRKGRLLLTMATLTLAGAIFIAVFSVSNSLVRTTDDLFQYFKYDLGIVFSKIQRIDRIEQEALQVPGVVAVESWGYAVGRMLRDPANENNSEQVTIYAPVAQTEMIQPQLVGGRWLLPEDENALVINTDVLKKFGPLKAGDKVTMKLEGRKSEWVVVGIVKSMMTGPSAYVNQPYFCQVVRDVGRAGSVQAVTDRHDKASQIAIVRELERHMKRAGLKVSFLQTTAEIKEQIIFQFNILVVFMLAMAGLLALVGALGLAGTMSINVVERTREIGVMRAVGAADGDIFRLVLAEGLLIGLASWAVGFVLAVPISRFMSNQVGMLFIETPLTYEFSVRGALLWLALLAAVSVAATWLPARNATKISVRESLSYE